MGIAGVAPGPARMLTGISARKATGTGIVARGSGNLRSHTGMGGSEPFPVRLERCRDPREPFSINSPGADPIDGWLGTAK